MERAWRRFGVRSSPVEREGFDPAAAVIRGRSAEHWLGVNRWQQRAEQVLGAPVKCERAGEKLVDPKRKLLALGIGNFP